MTSMSVTSIRRSSSVDLEGALDADTLEMAAQGLVQRHASLRAGFEHENLSKPIQVIVKSRSARSPGSTLRC